MSAKIKYSDGPIGEVEIVEDFLPSPEQLALQEETVKVTIALSKSSVEFFNARSRSLITSSCLEVGLA